MILLIETDNGEAWEDYRAWVETVYDVKTEKTGDELYAEWRNFIVDMLERVGISVNPTYTNVITINSRLKESKTTIRIVRIAHEKNPFDIWLKKNYVVNELKFQKIHPIPWRNRY